MISAAPRQGACDLDDLVSGSAEETGRDREPRSYRLQNIARFRLELTARNNTEGFGFSPRKMFCATSSPMRLGSSLAEPERRAQARAAGLGS